MLITKITYENMGAFRHMAPQQLWEPDKKGYFYLGALEDVPGTDLSAAVGCLIFRVQYDMVENRMLHVAVLKWLYVEEDHRKNGFASELLKEWRRIMSESELDAASLRLRTDQVELRACLEKNEFVFESQTEQICRMPLASACKKVRQTSDVPIPVSRLCEIREQTLVEALVRLGRQSEKLRASGYLLARKDAYEQELSCGTMEGGNLRTILLMQKPSDIELRIVAFRSFVPNGNKELLALLKTAFLHAEQSCSADVWLEFYCPDAQMQEVAKRLSEDCECYELCRGVCRVREEFPFLPGEALTYRTDSWTQTRLAGMLRPTISREANITSLDEWTPEETLAWGLQAEKLETLIGKVQDAAEQEILVPEYSLVYQAGDQVRAMLLVTGSPYAEMENVLYVNDWYVYEGKSYRELYYLLQQLFDRVNSLPSEDQTLTFICNDIWQKRMVEYLMEGAEQSVLVQPLSGFFPQYSMSAVRFQSLTELLAQAGFASILMYPPVGSAFLEVYLKHGDQVYQKIRFTYDTVDEDEMATGFVLHAVSGEPVGVSLDGQPLYMDEVREEPLELDAESTVQWMTEILKKVMN